MEFNELGDFIWKSPDFIKAASARERAKIAFSVPDDASEAEKEEAARYKYFRYIYEVRKVEDRFPVFLNSANLFISVSLYELHLVRLARYAEKLVSVRLDEQKGSGYSKCSNFFKAAGLNRSEITLYTEAESAVVIRNCLMHCGGLLHWSRDEKRIRQIAKKDLHLTDHTRNHNKRSGERYAQLIFDETGEGEKLVIPNQYAHIANGILRDHLIAIAHQVEALR